MNLINKDALFKIFHRYYGNDLIEVEDVIGWIEEQPTVEERKTGKWTIEDCHAATYKYCCSACGAHHRARYDFCPSCGARMESEK